MLELSKNLGYLSSVIANYSRGKKGYKDQAQFKAHYLITFPDNTEWIVFSTTSIRERIKQQYWESLNLKEINPAIKRAYVVYPDSISPEERNIAAAKNHKIIQREEFSTIEGIISQEELFNLIEEYSIERKTQGQKSSITGNNFEIRIAFILENPWNLKKWKTGDPSIDGIHYDIFKKIVTCFKLVPSEVVKITATANKNTIGFLPSGGLAKTDVLAFVQKVDGSVPFFTISCKRSSNSIVSVHQFNANVYADVLDPENNELRELLNLFQTCGNRYNMGEENASRLEMVLRPYIDRLILWALGGFYRRGNGYQCAYYILIYDNYHGSISIHSVFDYCSLLKSYNKGMFGTPFSWTYQGRRGTNIQLKCKTIK